MATDPMEGRPHTPSPAPPLASGDWRGRLRRLAVPLAAAIYFAVPPLLLCPTDAFWSGDAGVKLLQIQGLISSGGKSLALPYPGRAADPGLEHFPIDAPYAVRRGDEWYSTFAPFFPAATAPFYLFLGTRGLYVLPLLGGVVTVLLSGRLAANFGLEPRGQAVAGAVVALASPLAFYSATFWEHTPVVALLVGALVLLTGGCSPQRSITAGVCLGAAFALRLESAVFLAAVGLCLWLLGVQSQRWRIAAGLALGAAIPVAIVCTLNWIWFEHPLGLIGEHFRQGAGGDARSRAVIIAKMLWSEHGQGFQAALVPLFPACLAGVVALVPRNAGIKRRETSMAAPEQFVAAVSAVYFVAMLIVAPNPGGAQFGPRYLLAAMPGLLVAAVAAAARARRGRTVLWVLLGVLSLYSAVRGLEGVYRLVQLKRQIEGPMVDLVRRDESDAILIGHRYFAQQAAALYVSRPMYRLTGSRSDEELLDRLRSRGARQGLFVSELAPAKTPPRLLPPVRRSVRTAPLVVAVPRRLQARHYHFEHWDLSGSP